MFLGLAFISWDETLGPVTNFKYPKHLDLSPDLMKRIIMAHTLSESKGEELFEHEFNNQLIISYCDKTRLRKFGLEISMLIIHQKEKISISYLKTKLNSFSQSAFRLSGSARNDYIIEKLELFFRQTTEKKLLILGRGGTGKTTIKEVVFEGRDPRELIYNPLEPTRGITPSVYTWLDLNLGLFDSSGQEFDNMLDNENERNLAFENTSIVIYIFDYPSWVKNHQNVIDDIKKIMEIIKLHSYNANLIIFTHKIDLLINNQDRKAQDRFNTEMENKIKKELNLPLYKTSIYPEYIYGVHSAFCEILGMVTPESEYLRNLLIEKIQNYSKTLAFITNKNHSIVAQYISSDFDVKLINPIHNLVAQFNQSFLDMVENDNINYFLMSSYKGLIIIMKHLALPDYNISKIICVSQTLSDENLINIAEEFGIKLETIQTEF